MRPFALARPRTMLRALRSLRRDRQGAAALEFALVAPALFVILVGTLEVGVTLYRMASVQWALESAGRRAMIDGDVTQAELQQLVDGYIIHGQDGTGVSVSYQVDDTQQPPLARVTANFSHTIHIPMVNTYEKQFTVESYIPLPVQNGPGA